MNISRKITYSGMFLGSSFGWYFPVLINWKVSFFTKFFFSIIFGIIGVIVAYYLLSHFIKK